MGSGTGSNSLSSAWKMGSGTGSDSLCRAWKMGSGTGSDSLCRAWKMDSGTGSNASSRAWVLLDVLADYYSRTFVLRALKEIPCSLSNLRNIHVVIQKIDRY